MTEPRVCPTCGKWDTNRMVLCTNAFHDTPRAEESKIPDPASEGQKSTISGPEQPTPSEDGTMQGFGGGPALNSEARGPLQQRGISQAESDAILTERLMESELRSDSRVAEVQRRLDGQIADCLELMKQSKRVAEAVRESQSEARVALIQAVAQEREACAMEIDSFLEYWPEAVRAIAAAIRARGNDETV